MHGNGAAGRRFLCGAYLGKQIATASSKLNGGESDGFKGWRERFSTNLALRRQFLAQGL
jgi:hypothetical protein